MGRDINQRQHGGTTDNRQLGSKTAVLSTNGLQLDRYPQRAACHADSHPGVCCVHVRVPGNVRVKGRIFEGLYK